VFSDDLSILSKNKQEIQKLKKQNIEASSSKLKNTWVNPLSITASITKASPANGVDNTTKQYGIMLNQDIFRSGGIYYAIQYANASEELNLFNLNIENQNLKKQIILALLELKNLRLSAKQTALRVKNANIEVDLKKQLYTAGEIDIIPLNTALMSKNTLIDNELSLNNSIEQKKLELQKLTDLKEEQIVLPTFTKVLEKDFLKQNSTVKSLTLASKFQKRTHQINRSSLLPKVTLSGQYGKQDFDSKNNALDYDGKFYNYGLSVSLPLDIRTNATLEETQTSYLQSKLQLQEEKRSAKIFYNQTLKNIDLITAKTKVANQNLKLYEELINLTSKEVQAGTKTKYDLETLQNNEKIEKYNIKINEIQKQIQLANLYFLTLQR
jgi:outer membrane protein TolC